MVVGTLHAGSPDRVPCTVALRRLALQDKVLEAGTRSHKGSSDARTDEDWSTEHHIDEVGAPAGVQDGEPVVWGERVRGR